MPRLTQRTILVGSITTLLSIGLVFALYPFFASLGPRESAVSAVTKIVSTDELGPGDFKIVTWLGEPVIFYKASETEIFSYSGLSTYRGCSLEYLPQGEILGADWAGGWIDPCHLGAWDVTGKFVEGANSGEGQILADLATHPNLSWDGSDAVLAQ